MTEQTAPVVIEVTVGAPIEQVWQTLRDPEQIKLWHGWHYDQLDEEVQVIFVQNVQVDETEHTLQLGDGDRFELEAADGGTVVRVVRAPFVPDTEWSQYYNEITEGWLSFLNQLKFLHEWHPGEPRRTLFFTGTGPADAPRTLLTTVPTVVGDAQYVTEQQRGVLLPELGPGLLILAAKAPADDGRDSQPVDAMAIVTVYGLSDDDFAAAADTWTTWWRTGYPDADEAQV